MMAAFRDIDYIDEYYEVNTCILGGIHITWSHDVVPHTLSHTETIVQFRAAISNSERVLPVR